MVRGQTSAVYPAHRPPGAVVIAGGLANGVIGDAAAIEGSQQILPVGVPVGIGVGGIPRGFQKLALIIVGVGNGAFPGSGEGCDAAHAVIGIHVLLTAFKFIIPSEANSSSVF